VISRGSHPRARSGRARRRAGEETNKLQEFNSKNSKGETSMTRKQWLLSGFVAFTCIVSTSAGAGPIESYAPVTSQRLENPEPGNWMLYRRTYDGQGFS